MYKCICWSNTFTQSFNHVEICANFSHTHTKASTHSSHCANLQSSLQTWELPSFQHIHPYFYWLITDIWYGWKCSSYNSKLFSNFSSLFRMCFYFVTSPNAITKSADNLFPVCSCEINFRMESILLVKYERERGILLHDLMLNIFKFDKRTGSYLIWALGREEKKLQTKAFGRILHSHKIQPKSETFRDFAILMRKKCACS